MQENNPYSSPSAAVADIASEEGPVLAGRGARLLAVLLDGLIQGVILIPIYLLSGFWSMAMSGQSPGMGMALALSLGGFVVFLLVQGYPLSTSGQTWGKKALGIKIVDLDGRKPEFVRMVGLRYLTIQIVSAIPILGALLVLVDVLFIFAEDRRCLHDKIAGTRVVLAN